MEPDAVMGCFGCSGSLFIPAYIVWSIVKATKRNRKLAESKAEELRQQQEVLKEQQWDSLCKDLQLASDVLPQSQACEQLILQQFDCRPCPRCAELGMLVDEITPNGRSLVVRCDHCRHSFRWKAVQPDTTDASSACRNLMKTFEGTSNKVIVCVPPNKFSTEGGRELIPQGVRQVVWRRDGGRCVQCGADVNLHFDHIIPVAKGGATTVENIQILCAPCNLSKGAKI